MKYLNDLSAALSLALFVCPIAGQDPGQLPVGDEDLPPEGHSHQGHAFNEGPRQAAYLMGGTGNVSFPVTTNSEEAQAYFNQGVGQLHGFWYFEAERSFRQVALIDPDCAMAYWGMSMANTNNRTRGASLVYEALLRKEGVSEKEEMWIDGLAAFHDVSEDNPPAEPETDGSDLTLVEVQEARSSTGRGRRGRRGEEAQRRARNWVRSLEAIVRLDPTDIEAKAFLALEIWENGRRGVPVSSHQAVDRILDDVFAGNPMHPAHHYRIHLWDNEKAEIALPSAARVGQSATDIAHMWHMGGHILAKLNRHGDAAWQQEASARVDHARMIRDRVMPYQTHNYGHNNEWLTRSLSHVGRVHEALAVAKNMVEQPRHPLTNRVERRSSIAGYGRTRLFDVPVIYEMWNELIDLCHTAYLQPTEVEAEQAKRLSLLGQAYFLTGALDRGDEMLAELETLLEGKEGRANESLLANLHGYQLLAKGDPSAALEEFDNVNRMRPDVLAEIHLQAGDGEKALELIEEAVERNPGKLPELVRKVLILEGVGKGEEARATFQEVRILAAEADLDVPLLGRLAPMAASLGLSRDWRIPAVATDDTGVRPDVVGLGPLRWQPSRAPDWRLPGSEGIDIALSDYAGRPVLVIFYLGFGCLHCVEQLEMFSPMADEYAAAGIDIVAVGTDSVAGMMKSVAMMGENPFAFPLAADPEMKIFRQWRTYDDFEDLPLHGTFLIDAEGLLRWGDISYEPFGEPEFLLKEAQRLLAMERPVVR
jgi:peroxiredoxin